LWLGLYDVVIAFDHQTEQAWIISQGFPEHDPLRRRRRAKARAAEFGRCLATAHRTFLSTLNASLPAENLSPQFPVRGINGLTSNFSQDGYLAMIRRGIEYIFAGDVFQVNLAQRLMYPASDDSVSLYLRLRERNPAPFAAYFDLGTFQIVSASPERFLQVSDRHVEARPIKGTRRRAIQSEADQLAGMELLTSEKDRAENVMIVDLLRNDLSRVCEPDRVIVSELCRLERYQFVQHLVSVVHGALREEFGPLDLLRAAFPGGSVTGAPKIRAMEIIAKLEATARGAYCGALGYIGFDGTMDSSILIRTITAARGWWQFPVGGGIVAQSDPEREHQETWDKAEGMLQAL
jgi:para-aminobenzoate synthetase component 1